MGTSDTRSEPDDMSGGDTNMPLDAHLADLLATYDELLALGVGDLTSDAPTAEIDSDFQGARACLQILEHVFPRSHAHDRSDNDGEAADEQPTYRLGPFEILHELGRGGGGMVFLAIESGLGRKVALKIPYPEVLVRRDLRQRFVQEAQAAAQLDHPHIIPIYSAGEIGPICYIAAAYCDGPTLAAWLGARRSPVPFRTAAQIVAALADAVEHAHARGILHRDIKPANVLLEQRSVPAGPPSDGDAFEDSSEGLDVDGVTLVPKLTDFGLAKLQEREQLATRTGAVLGTPAYMAPEQAEGRLAEINATTDVYGLGILLYELITGRPPFQSDVDLETLHAVARDDPPLPRLYRRQVPRDLEAICLKCLEKNSARRYQRAIELRADLQRYLTGQPTAARRIRWPGRAIRWARRRPAAATLYGALLLFGVAGVIGTSWHAGRVERIEASASARLQRQADDEHARTRRLDYATHIQGAYQAWQTNDLTTAMKLLDRCRPGPGEEDLRRWEWYYVRQLCAGGLLTLRGHQGAVLRAVFSPDGKRLGSCGEDGSLRIWDVATGILQATTPAHEGFANAVAWSADGRFLATVGDDAVVRLWDAESHKLRGTLQGAVGKLRTVVISPDSRSVAAAGDEGVIRIWDATAGKEILTIRGHTDTIRSVAFAPSGDRIASGGADRTARIWDLSTPGEPSAVLDLPAPLIYSVVWSPDGQTLATVDEYVTLWDVSRLAIFARIGGHQGEVFSVAFAPDGQTMATASNDKSIKTWDVTARDIRVPNDFYLGGGKLLHTYRGHTNVVSDVTFSSQGTRLASVSRDGTIQLWDPTQPQDRRTLVSENQPTPFIGVAFAPIGTTLAVVRGDEEPSRLQIWRSLAAESTVDIMFPGKIDRQSLAFSPDGSNLAFAVENGPVSIYDLVHGSMRTVVEQRDRNVHCDFSPDGRQLAVASNELNSTQIVEVATGKVLSRVPGQRAVAFSPDGRLLATESSQVDEFFRVELWDVAAGKSAGHLLGHTGFIVSIAFSVDGRLVATGSADGTARLWSMSARQEIIVMRHSRQGIRVVDFFDNDTRLATAGSDGTVKIWDVGTGRQLLSLDVTDNNVTAMAVSGDGRALVTAATHSAKLSRVDLWTAPVKEDE